MTPILCKYKCGTMLDGFDEETHKYIEATTGGIHTKERCQEAKANLKAKNDHGNENWVPVPKPLTIPQEKKEYVDHTIAAKGQSKVKIFFDRVPLGLEQLYNEFLDENNGKIKTQGAQFQMNNGNFAIALYYEEVAKQ